MHNIRDKADVILTSLPPHDTTYKNNNTPFKAPSLPSPIHFQPPHLPGNIEICSAFSHANVVDVVVYDGRLVLPSKDAVPSHQVEGAVGRDYG